MNSSFSINTFSASKNFLVKTITNHEIIQKMCEKLNVVLDSGYFNVVNELCIHVSAFQKKIIETLIEAQRKLISDMPIIINEVFFEKIQVDSDPSTEIFCDSKKSLEKNITNHSIIQKICQFMDITLDDGYFNFISELSDHVSIFQKNVITMLIDVHKKMHSNKPIGAIKSAVDTKPIVESKPIVASKHLPINKPIAESKHIAQSKPIADTKSNSVSKPIVNIKSMTPSKSVVPPVPKCQYTATLEVSRNSSRVQNDDNSFSSKVETKVMGLEIASKGKLSAKEQLFLLESWY